MCLKTHGRLTDNNGLKRAAKRRVLRLCRDKGARWHGAAEAAVVGRKLFWRIGVEHCVFKADRSMYPAAAWALDFGIRTLGTHRGLGLNLKKASPRPAQCACRRNRNGGASAGLGVAGCQGVTS